jgi:predicted alpha/beta hydrolase
MGVVASFYDRLADALAPHQIQAYATEWRGHGTSSMRASAKHNWGYREVLTQDLPAALECVQQAHPGVPTVVLGHSLGGQLGSIFAANYQHKIHALVTVASCSIDHRGWRGAEYVGVSVFTRASDAIARVVRYYPGDKLGFGGREARGVVRDWAHQASTGEYRAQGLAQDLEQTLRAMRRPVLMVSCEGDWYAPICAVERLRAKMPNALVERWHYHRCLSVKRSLKEHFAWAKEPSIVSAQIAQWLDHTLVAHTRSSL